eukprot:1312488-Rhodomonas_salina.3
MLYKGTYGSEPHVNAIYRCLAFVFLAIGLYEFKFPDLDGPNKVSHDAVTMTMPTRATATATATATMSASTTSKPTPRCNAAHSFLFEKSWLSGDEACTRCPPSHLSTLSLPPAFALRSATCVPACTTSDAPPLLRPRLSSRRSLSHGSQQWA